MTGRVPKIPLGLASPFTTGATPSTKDARYFGEGHAWANISDLGPRNLSRTAKSITQLGLESASFGARAEPGDLLFSFKLSVGAVSIATRPMYTNEAIATFKEGSLLNPRYAYYMLPIYLLRAANHNIYGAPLLNDGIMQRAKVPVPDRETQQRIADYLDRETGEIDAMLAKMDELTGTLEARRRTAVSRATSRGIDGATVVASGNPYIGLKPAHWTMTRFGAEFDIEGGQVDPREEPWASMILVGPNHIVSHRGQIVGRETARDQGADSGKYVAHEGQILYSKIRPALNKVAIAQEDCLISADMYALSSRTGSDHRYLVYMLLSSNFHGYVSEISMRVKMPKVNREELSLAALALPPVDEQTRIADHLDEVTGKIDQMLAKTAELKSLLTERRSALITDVVTGKKQVQS